VPFGFGRLAHVDPLRPVCPEACERAQIACGDPFESRVIRELSTRVTLASDL
jgi:hypothetical protein